MNQSNKNVTAINSNVDLITNSTQRLLPIGKDEFVVGDTVLVGGIRHRILEFNTNNTQALLEQWQDGSRTQTWFPIERMQKAPDEGIDDETRPPSADADPLKTSEVEMPDGVPGEQVKTLVQPLGTSEQIEAADRAFETMISAGFLRASEYVVWDYAEECQARVVRFVKPFAHPADQELQRVYEHAYSVVLMMDKVIRRRSEEL